MDTLLDKYPLLNVKDSEINILLLGETGVGKSTFINAFANYLCHDNINEAIKKPPIVCAPTCVSLLNENNETISISVCPPGEKKSSSTDGVKEYLLPIEGQKRFVRFIDTPGMGSAKGVEQDDTNMNEILNYMLNQSKLHAICFFMKPTTTRSNALFEYCLKQFLSRLEKSASKNLIFIFTNTRSTFYTPGETMPCLREIVDTIKSNPPFVRIPFDRKNRFCMDNETFKYLAVLARNIKLDSTVIESASKSWEVSALECKRLISYIDQLIPHQMSKTIDINKSKVLIEQHFQVLFDVSQMIDDNVRFMKKFYYELETERHNLNDLKQKLSAPKKFVEIVQLPHPMIVCTAYKCTDRVDCNGTAVGVYHQICHDNPDTKSKRIWDFEKDFIRRCLSLKKDKCVACGCHHRTHKLYSQLRSVSTVPDENKSRIMNEENILQKRMETLETLTEDIKEQSGEHHDIIASIAKFTAFLQSNSISPISDEFMQNVKHLIDQEENLGTQGDWDKQISLKKMLQKYEKAKFAFANQHVETTLSDMQENLEQLYKLKHNGIKIKQLCEQQTVSVRDLSRNSTESQNTRSETAEKSMLKSNEKWNVKTKATSSHKDTSYKNSYSNKEIPFNKDPSFYKDTTVSVSSDKRLQGEESKLDDANKLKNQKSTRDFGQYVNMDEEMRRLYVPGHLPGLSYQQTPWSNLPHNHLMYAPNPYYGSPYSQFPPNNIANFPPGPSNYRPQHFPNPGVYNPNFSMPFGPNYFQGNRQTFERQQPAAKPDQAGNDLSGSWK